MDDILPLVTDGSEAMQEDIETTQCVPVHRISKKRALLRAPSLRPTTATKPIPRPLGDVLKVEPQTKLNLALIG